MIMNGESGGMEAKLVVVSCDNIQESLGDE
jgi:hypothetical protein